MPPTQQQIQDAMQPRLIASPFANNSDTPIPPHFFNELQKVPIFHVAAGLLGARAATQSASGRQRPLFSEL